MAPKRQTRRKSKSNTRKSKTPKESSEILLRCSLVQQKKGRWVWIFVFVFINGGSF